MQHTDYVGLIFILLVLGLAFAPFSFLGHRDEKHDDSDIPDGWGSQGPLGG